MNYNFIAKIELFKNVPISEIKIILNCLQPKIKTYKKGEYIYRIGNKINQIGIILSGSVNIEKDEFLGNHNIIENIQQGNVFAETYACTPENSLMINVVSAELSEILFLNAEEILNPCSKNCEFHNKIIKNLLTVTSKKNLNLTRKINILTQRTIRDKGLCCN